MYQIIRKADNGRNGGEQVRQNSFTLQNGEQLEYLTFPLLEETGVVKHLFSTRTGGVSEGCLATMNLSFARGDEPGNVEENYRRVAEVLECGTADMVASRQTHTTNIRLVGAADRGKGIMRPTDYENIDGLLTDEPGIVLVTSFADCVPLYFVDTVHRAIGLAHSGWKGTAAGMGARMVEEMKRQFGSRPQELLVAIGPSICADCYEVGEEVAGQFAQYEGAVRRGRAPGKYQLDLWSVNRQLLLHAGVSREHIAVTDICTCCNSQYLFSHRATGGRRGNLALR